MKLIKPSFEILSQEEGLSGIYKMIEVAGRNCYKSEEKITEDSAKEFVNRMIKSGHGAMLEHGTVYLNIKPQYNGIVDRYYNNKYSKVNVVPNKLGYEDSFITANFRILIENNWLDDLQYICEPTEYHEKRHTVKFICDRGVSHEFVRHRVFSFAQESTRYCNYSRDKFGNELTFIIPCWITRDEKYDFAPDSILCIHPVESPEVAWIHSLVQSEKAYNNLINKGWIAQQARSVLPNSLKTELVMTGFVSDWKHFFDLRCNTAAHPQARELAIPLQDEFKKNLYI